ncbi:MAG: pantetheine-phosphate adenylyltransferase [Syntrophobacteraceae bacterium]|nr:pantetheine-phosphate adenylyltransferase [Syntrophobacteraceae bacterium]
MEKVAVYPGSFDPITNGHVDLLERGMKIFDRIVIAIAANPAKKPLFSLEERLEMIAQSLESHPLRDRMQIDIFHGLLVDYVRTVKADAILRGLRAISDFEYEFQMALMNRKLSSEIETLFLMTAMRWIYISSRIIKEVVTSGGCVTGLVPGPVEQKLIEKLRPAAKTSL